MRHATTLTFLTLAALLRVFGGGSADTEAPDEEVKQNVVAQLTWNDSIDASDIRVEVRRGVVELSGTVATPRMIRAAEREAASVRGVSAVSNRLEVLPQAPSRDELVQRQVQQALSEDGVLKAHALDADVSEGIVVLEGAVDALWKKRRAEAIAAEVSRAQGIDNRIRVRGAVTRPDAEVRAAVEGQLERAPSVDAERVEVAVDDGVVTLTGVLETLEGVRAALEIAERTVGVREVNDRLTARVRPEAADLDAEIRADIAQRLEWDARTSGEGIRVSVERGEVTLSGTVQSTVAKDTAMEISESVPGVFEVVNRITVETDPQVSDARLRRLVERELAERPPVYGNVEVEVSAGEVVLGGTVDSYWKKLAAGNIAGEVPGVGPVANELVVVVGEDRDDREIARDVQAALERKAAVDAGSIEVVVREGTVSLLGTVDTPYQREQAVEAAVFTEGVRDVRNRLRTLPSRREGT